jgi:hypothetical protein
VLSPANITACIVTRGDVDLEPIYESLIFGHLVVWNNAERPDWKVAGRYMAALEAPTPWVYWQDDDTIVPPDTQMLLVDEFDGDMVANWGHGDDPDGYEDLPLVCGGAIAYKWSAWNAILRYGCEWPLDEPFKFEADFIVGSLYRDWRHVKLPFEIRDVAYNGRRLADEPWQRELKLELTTRARLLREKELAAGAIYMRSERFGYDETALEALGRYAS